MKRKIIGFLTIFIIFIFGNTYSAGPGGQGALLGSGGNQGGMSDPLAATLLMPQMMAPVLQSNAGVSIALSGIGTLPQINPITPSLTPAGMNNIMFNPVGIQPAGPAPVNGMYNIALSGLGMSGSGSPLLGTSPLGIPGQGGVIGYGVGPMMEAGLGTLISFGPSPMMSFGINPMMGFAPGPMMGLGPGSMMGFAPGPMMGFGPGPLMSLVSGPNMGMPYNSFTPWQSTLPFNLSSPISNSLSAPVYNISTSLALNNPQTDTGREASEGRRVIFLGTYIEGTRPDGTPNVVKLYLDTYTGKRISGYSQGVDLPAPEYHWWYGCAPTSAGMIMGYYDVYGYKGIPYDLVLGGLAELSSFYPGSPFPIDPPLDPPSPKGPTLLCNKAIASAGHLADFWLSYGSTGDPLASGRAIPSQFDCLADFMGTSQDNLTSTGEGNPDGQTFFYFWSSGARMTNIDLFNLGYDVYNHSGAYGIIEYTEYCGHDGFIFNQYILGYQGNSLGFSFSDYVGEIDAGRPVIIHMTGHMMLGIGYDLATETVLVHDTWNNSDLSGPLTMPWGGTYQDPDGVVFSQYAVTCFIPQ